MLAASARILIPIKYYQFSLEAVTKPGPDPMINSSIRNQVKQFKKINGERIVFSFAS